MYRAYLFLLICGIVLITQGCNNETTKKDLDYDQTKKMVVDILQTDEGKSALQSMIADDKMKQHLIMDSDVVKESITEVLVSEQGAEMWQKLFEDPAFVESFNQSIAEEQKKLFKSLMNDAEFQKQMLELLQNPEILNQTLTLMKSQQFREHLEETIQQTLETPLFQAKIQQLLLKAAEQKQKSEEEQGSQSEDEGDSGSSDEGSNSEGEEGGEESSS